MSTTATSLNENEILTLVSDFEKLCGLLQTDPVYATDELIKYQADSKAIYLAQHVFNYSNKSEAHYHAASLLTNAAIRQWSILDKETKTSLKDFVVNKIFENYFTAQGYIINQLLQAFAVLWKRSWEEESLDSKSALINDIRELGSHETNNIIACRLLYVLVTEFSVSKSVVLGQPREFHRRVHKDFESTVLMTILDISMSLLWNVLQELDTKNELQSEDLIIPRLKWILHLLTEIMDWSFGDIDPLQEDSSFTSSDKRKQRKSGFGDSSSTVIVGDLIHPPMAWRTLLINRDLIIAVCNLYHKSRESILLQECSHLIRQFFIQLGSLSGAIFESKQKKVEFASDMIESSIELLRDCMRNIEENITNNIMNDESIEQEMLAFCTFFEVCCVNFQLPILSNLSFFDELLKTLSYTSTFLLNFVVKVSEQLVQLQKFGSSFYQITDLSQVESIRSLWAMYAYDSIISCWIVLIEDPTLGLIGPQPYNEDSNTISPRSLNTGIGIHKINSNGNFNGDGDISLGHDEASLEHIRQLLSSYGGDLFVTFVETRVIISRSEIELSFLETEVDNEVEDNDEIDSSEQIQKMAIIGRLNPVQSISFLYTSLANENSSIMTIAKLSKEMIEQQTLNLDVDETQLQLHFEEARIIIQMIGHLFADECEVDIPYILHRECFKSESQYFLLMKETMEFIIQITRDEVDKLMTHPNHPLYSPFLNEALLTTSKLWAKAYLMPDEKMYEDYLIAPMITSYYGIPLTAQEKEERQSFFEGQNYSSSALQNGSREEVSDENNISVELAETFLTLVWSYLSYGASEESVCNSALDLLKVLLVSNSNIALYCPKLTPYLTILSALEQEHNHPIENLIATGNHDLPDLAILGFTKLRPSCRGELLEIMGSSILGRKQVDSQTDLEIIVSYFNSVVITPNERINQLLKYNDIKQPGISQTKYVSCTLDVIQTFVGLSRCTDYTEQDVLVNFIVSNLEKLLILVDLLHVYPEIIKAMLIFFRDFAEVQMTSLNAQNTIVFLDAVNKVLVFYSTNYLQSYNHDPDAEEDEDILCILHLLSHIGEKLLCDFGDYDNTAEEQQLATNQVLDILFLGFKDILPLMTEDLLRFPSLARAFFSMTQFVVENNMDRLVLLDDDYFQQFLDVISYGLKHAEAVIARDSIRVIEGLATFHARAVKSGTSIGLGNRLVSADTIQSLIEGNQPNLGSSDVYSDVLMLCIKEVLHLIIFETSIWDRLDACSTALLQLYICDHSRFSIVADRFAVDYFQQHQDLIHSNMVQRFYTHINALIEPVDQYRQMKQGQGQVFVLDRNMKQSFRENVKEFALQVRPFMQIY